MIIIQQARAKQFFNDAGVFSHISVELMPYTEIGFYELLDANVNEVDKLMLSYATVGHALTKFKEALSI